MYEFLWFPELPGKGQHFPDLTNFTETYERQIPEVKSNIFFPGALRKKKKNPPQILYFEKLKWECKIKWLTRVRYVNWTTHQAVVPAEMAWVSSALLQKRNEVKRIHHCVIPARRAVNVSQACSKPDPLQWALHVGLRHLAPETNFSSCVPSRHGGTGSWTGSLRRGMLSTGSLVKALLVVVALLLCGQIPSPC